MTIAWQIHLWAAMIGLYLQPISTATSNIGFGIALGGTLPALLANPRAFAECWKSAWLRWLLAWLAFSWLSLLWSSDARFGVEQFRACRVLLWIPVLWPLRQHWMWLVTALLTGTTLLQGMQALQTSPLRWPVSPKFGLGHGLTSPTQTGLWDAVSLSFLLLFVVMGKWWRTIAFLPLAVLAAAGLVWSATRASVIGVVVELVAASGILAWTSRGWLKRAVVRCVVGLAILGGVSLVARSQLQAKFEQAVRETKQTIEGAGPVNAEFRLSMWRMTLEGWRQHPILGVGIGGIPKTIAEHSTVVYNETPLKEVRMIHSTYIQVLAETGLVGAALFAGFMGCFFRDALRMVRAEPVRITALGACIVWFVAAAFDGYQQSGGFLTVGAICMALATMPGASAEQSRTGADSDH
jgi:O-antigen ligase